MVRTQRRSYSSEGLTRFIGFVVAGVLAVATLLAIRSRSASLSRTDGALAVVAAVGIVGLVVSILRLAHRELPQRADSKPGRSVGVALLDRLLTIPPVEFRQALSDVLQRIGYDVDTEPPARDFDLQARDHVGSSVAIRYRQYPSSQLCSDAEVAEFVDRYKSVHKVDRGLLVTTSTFARDAERLAKTEPSLELWNGEHLVELMRVLGSQVDDAANGTAAPTLASPTMSLGWLPFGFAILALAAFAGLAVRGGQTPAGAPVVATVSKPADPLQPPATETAVPPTSTPAPSPTAAASAAPGAASASGQPSTPAIFQVVNAGTVGLAVRATPAGTKKGTLKEGNLVQVLDSVNGWDHVQGNGFEGYVSAQYLSRATPTANPQLARLSP